MRLRILAECLEQSCLFYDRLEYIFHWWLNVCLSIPSKPQSAVIQILKIKKYFFVLDQVISYSPSYITSLWQFLCFRTLRTVLVSEMIPETSGKEHALTNEHNEKHGALSPLLWETLYTHTHNTPGTACDRFSHQWISAFQS